MTTTPNMTSGAVETLPLGISQQPTVAASPLDELLVPGDRGDTPGDPPGGPPAVPPDRTARRRLLGIDIARALALFGMFTQHVIIWGDDGGTSTGVVGWFFEESLGRASVLFFVLSGVSLSMIHRKGSFSATPAVLRRRGVLLLVGGLLLTQAVWSASILQQYGVAFLLAPWLLRLGARGLAAVTTAGLIGGPIAMLWLPGIPVAGWWSGETGDWLITQVWDLFVSGTYPMVIWLGFFTLGMLIGRTDLQLRRTVVAIVVGGVLATLLFGSIAKGFAGRYDGVWNDEGFIESEFQDRVFGENEFGDDEFIDDEFDGSGIDDAADFDEMTDAELGALIREGMGEFEMDPGIEFGDDAIYWQVLYDTSGHSGQIGWTLQTSGIAVAILGFALLIPRWMDGVLYPLAALGSMSLTAYLVHIALITDVWGPHVESADWSIGMMEFVLLGLMATMTLICVLFQRWLGIGPFEKLLKYFALRPGDRLAAAQE